MAPPAFLSYSRKDSVAALKVATFLRDREVPVWIDQLDIPAGAKWDTTIENALRDTEFVVILLTPNAVTSQNVLDEIGFAIDEQKRIVTVLLEECKVPLRLRRLQYIDCRNDMDSGLARVATILGFVPKPYKPTAAPHVFSAPLSVPAAAITVPITPPAVATASSPWPKILASSAAAHEPKAAPSSKRTFEPLREPVATSSALDKTIALGTLSIFIGIVFAFFGGFKAFVAATAGVGLFWFVVMVVPDEGFFYRLVKAVLCVSSLVAGIAIYATLVNQG